MERGWFKVWRKIEDHWTWNKKPFDSCRAFLDIIKRARYKKGTISNGKDRVILERGQVIVSQEGLARDWGWSRGKVRRWLKQMCFGLDSELIQKTDGQMTILTVRNYEIYQGDEPSSEPRNGHQTDR